MTRPIPEHGTNARYRGRQNLPPCHCQQCTRAASRGDAERRLDRLSGNPRTAPPELFDRVLQHLRYLVAQDMSQHWIAEVAGVHQTTVSDLVVGQRLSMTTRNAHKLLQVRPSDRTETCMVSAVGTMRRLRALAWMRHRFMDIQQATGIHRDSLLWLARGKSERTTAAREAKIREVYDRLSMTDGGSSRARAFAVKHGWDGPLAWDDETIDDPRAVPQTDAVEPVATEGGNVAARWLMGEAVVLDREARREVLQHLFEWTNDTTAEIAERLEMTPEAAERAWGRMKERATAEGRRLWRRAYVPRDRPLDQDDMEEAA
ncbi:hypothetical protein AB0G67_40210 [Streptomyces sp. NPDC021056]|uniref:hypothetical protein n=1 Tax=Streptomyces sp. NPDC021056 TaxID=3155012 RepID=UPI0033F05691